ncbi:MAG TPA: IS1595 family transposase [Solirubrobacteraceae bacterium]|nr:IS1595 family transposase [Solirubrobacteraceae bacterium]
MSINLLQLADHLRSEAGAYELLEHMRWGDKPVCPHCGSVRKHYFLKAKDGARKTRTGSATERRVWKCADCRRQFTVLVGTIFHGSKIPLRIWLLVIFDACSAKNGISAREVERKYGLTAKTAWFMMHRIREAMKREPMAGMLAGRVILDETWVGGAPKNRHGNKRSKRPQGLTDKTPVVALVSRETGEVRSQAVPNVRAENLRPILQANINTKRAHLHTDSGTQYPQLAEPFAAHSTVDHKAGEYVRQDVTTNHAETFFSQLKRSLSGTFHHVSREHLDRYLAEFDFRYTTCKLSDTERVDLLVGRVGGRRLMYRQPAAA